MKAKRLGTQLVGADHLRWRRVYSGPDTRAVAYSDLDVEGGTYRLRALRGKSYKVSWVDRTGGDTREIDLGQYITRTECDQRVLKHRATGR